MKVAFFLEDIGHERFLTSLTTRIAAERGVRMEASVLNATGGSPRLDAEFEKFLKDYSARGTLDFDLVVVAKDTDCRGVQTVIDEIERRVGRVRHPARTVVAAPEPHIECWYLADPSAIQRVLESPSLPAIPDSRCGRGRFKTRLSQTVRDAGVLPLLDGIEYAESIIEKMDLYQATKNVPSLARFVDDLGRALQDIRQE